MFNLDPTNSLISEVSRKLAQNSGNDLSNHIIVTPTQRSSLLMDLELAKALGAFIPPKILNYQQFLTLLINKFDLQLPKIFESSSFKIMARLIFESKNYQFLSPNSLDHCLDLLDDIYLSGIDNSSLLNNFNKITEDEVYHQQEHHLILTNRLKELLDFDQELQNFSQKNNFITPYQEQAYKINIICDFLSKNNITNLITESIWFVGVTTLREIDLALLSNLEKYSKIHFFSPTNSLFNSKNPIPFQKHIQNQLQNKNSISKLGLQQKKCLVIESNHALAEVKQACKIVQDAISQGIHAENIHIAVTREAIYSDLLKNEFSKHKIKVNFALSKAFNLSALGSWLFNWQSFLNKPTTATLLNLLFHPLEKPFINKAINRDNITKLDIVVNDIVLSFLKKQIISKNGYGEFSVVESKLSLKEHLDTLKITIETIHHLLSKDEASWATGIINQLNELTNLYTQKIKLSDFFRILHQLIETKEFHAPGSALEGVQILRISEMRLVPSDLCIVLGCNEGNLPALSYKDEILDLHSKRQLGLPCPEHLIELERLHLNLLEHHCKNLVLSFSNYHNNKSQSMSSFLIERVHNDWTLIKNHENNISSSIQSTNNSSSTPYLKITENQLTKFSATSLKNLINCPFKFGLQQYKIEPLEFLNESDPRIEGQILHAIIHGVFTGKINNKPVLSMLSSNEIDAASTLNFEKLILDRCIEATKLILPKSKSGLALQLINYSWPKFAKFFTDIFISDPKVFPKTLSEFNLNSLEIKLESADHEYSVSGQLDLLVNTPKFWLLCDFKKSLKPEAKKDALIGVEPQLGFYSSALFKSDIIKKDTPFVLGYWDIIKGEWLPVFFEHDQNLTNIPNSAITKKTLKFSESDGAWQELLIWRMQELKNNQMQAKADTSYCEFCAFETSCRKQDPIYEDFYINQNRIEELLKKSN